MVVWDLVGYYGDREAVGYGGGREAVGYGGGREAVVAEKLWVMWTHGDRKAVG